MRTLEEAIEEELQARKEGLYLKYQAKAGFKVGDRVKIFKSAESYELGWNNPWFMNDKVGEIGTIKEIDDSGILVTTDTGSIIDDWYYPYFVLEKVSSPTIEFLMPDDTWDTSACDEENIQDYTYVTETNKYFYYHDNGNLLYRVKKEQQD